MRPKQKSLFETHKAEGYPLSMEGYWKGFKAFAIVDTPEQEKELLKQGYTRCATELIETSKK
jgi:hypothetical protein